MHQSQEQGRSEREKFQLDSKAVFQIVEQEPAVDRLGLGGDAVRQFGALAGVALASWFLRGQMISLIFQGMQNAASVLLNTDLRNVTHAAPLAGAAG